MSAKGLGPRGIDALFGSTANTPAAAPNIQAVQENDIFKEVPTLSLVPSTVQPRKTFDEEHLKELASSIQEKGIVQPLVVRRLPSGQYEIIAGERRWRAAKILGLEQVPTIIRDYSDTEIMTIALIENIQRENLNPLEEAEAFATLKNTYKLSQEELAKSLGKSRPSVANALRLLNLPENIRIYMLEGKLSAAHGRTLLALDSKELLDALTDRIVQYSLSVRDTENLVEYANAYNRLPELSVTATTLNPLQDGANIANKQASDKANAKRRLGSKPKTFVNLQKQLRTEVHRGTSISGNLENGKIVLPFAGKQEFESLLKLLSVKNFKSVVALLNEELNAGNEVSTENLEQRPVEEFIEVGGITDILTDTPVDILAEEFTEVENIVENSALEEDIVEDEAIAEIDEMLAEPAPVEDIEEEQFTEVISEEIIEEEMPAEELAIEELAPEELAPEELAVEEPTEEMPAEEMPVEDFLDTGDLPEIGMTKGAPVVSGEGLFNVLDEVPDSLETLDDLASIATEEAK